jgi:steroid delta-isomerase-like uncharacterized protein
VSTIELAGQRHEVVSEMAESDQTGAGSAPESERNKAVIRRFVEEVQNNQDWTAYDELNDPSFVNLSAPPGVPTSREGGKVYLQAFASAYPDASFTIDDMIAEGDQVVTKKTFSGTNTGEFAGMPATGRSVSLQYVDIMRVRDGRIVEHWLSMNQLLWLQQLGLAPA